MKKRLLILALSLGLGVAGLSACQKKAETTITESVETKSKVVKLADYKGIEVNELEVEATDEEVEGTIEYELLTNSEEIDILDRPLEGGDIAIFDFEGKVNGEVFEGGTAKDYRLQIGSGNFIAGFEDGMIGMNIGETKELNLKFPEDYKEDLAGKDVVFTVKLNAIKFSKKAELNDEFVQKVTNNELKTVDEYKNKIKEDVLKRKADNAKFETQNLAVEKIIKGTEFDIDAEELNAEVEKQKEVFKQTASNYGVEYEEFLKMNGMTEESFVEFAERPLKVRLVVDAIFKAEKFKIKDDYYSSLSEKYGLEVEDLKSNYAEAVKSEYVVDYIYNNAKITKVKDFEQITFETEESTEETKAE